MAWEVVRGLYGVMGGSERVRGGYGRVMRWEDRSCLQFAFIFSTCLKLCGWS